MRYGSQGLVSPLVILRQSRKADRASASLQISFLLNIAAAVLTYVSSFPYAPKSTFSLLEKLDLAFSSLLKGVDPETNGLLPGFETGRRMTVTEKVRLRSVVECTRVQAVKMRGSENPQEAEPDTTASETEMESSYGDDFTGQEDWGMETARVYERTLVDLSDALDGNSLFPAG